MVGSTSLKFALIARIRYATHSSDGLLLFTLTRSSTSEGNMPNMGDKTEQSRIAEGFLEVVEVFSDLIDRDRYSTVLLRCADISRVEDGGILLTDGNGGLTVSVASSGAVLSLLGQSSLSERPTIRRCLSDGVPIVAHFSPADIPFDSFAGQALNLGFQHEYVFPVAYRGRVLGTVVLLDRNEIPIDPWRVDVTGTLAQTTGAMMHHAHTNALLGGLVGQLQAALDARVLVEQAKGVLAERNGQSVDEAFRILRLKARNERRAIIDVARDVVPHASR